VISVDITRTTSQESEGKERSECRKLWGVKFTANKFRVAISATNNTYYSTIPTSTTVPPRTSLQKLPPILMHRTSTRPAPLDFLLPSAYSTFGVDRRKDIGLPRQLPQFAPVYFEAPVKEGLRTPPADDMTTTYQTQYSDYAGRRDGAYSASGASGANYGGAYTGANVQSRPYSIHSQPPSGSASSLRKEVHGQPIHTQAPSPVPPSKINNLAPEEQPRRKSATSDMIHPNLQIPSSINNSGGSLAEFAAQVLDHGFFLIQITK
jgi:hypothetical protein